jgi:transcriptional regulator with XRE-family HTH domain
MNNIFGKFIKGARKDKKLTLEHVSRETGISRSYLSMLENGKRDLPGPRVQFKLCLIYDISLLKMVCLLAEIISEELREGNEAINES